MCWKKVCTLVLSTFLLVALVLGCGTSTGGKQGSKVLRVASGAEPETLDPRKSTGISESYIENQIFEGLCAKDQKGNSIPGVAERWDISADGLKYVFYLRSNAKWSNGDQVTAHDFEYAWKSMLNPAFGSRFADQLYYLKNGKAYNKKEATVDQVGVKALNDTTLEVLLEKPTAYFLSLMSFHTYFPVHKKTVEANPKWSADVKTLIGNGPFKMTNWVHNSKIEVVKNDKYWDQGKVKLDKIEFVLSENNSTVLSMFEGGQIDLAEVVPPSAETERLIKEGKLKIYPYLGVYYYTCNTSKPPFDNVKVRKAFALAIDREAIVNKVTRSGQKSALAWVPFGLADAKQGDDYRKVGGDYFKDNDIETAKKLLAEAGYPEGKGLPPITLLFNTSDEHKAIAEAVQEMWKKNLGVAVSLNNQEWKVYLQTRSAGNFQISRGVWIGDYADPMTFMDLMMTGNGNNQARWGSAEYDRLVEQARSTIDQNIRMKAMHEAEKILLDEMPNIPIYFYTNRILEKPNVKGVIRGVDGSVFLREAYVE